ncbi:energy transducer TonB [Methylocaldum sp.]|uniref:energy transducer TonB n=1 Tax=Methylocaldum sp. TaxID=1969727 RepID=UPI002D61B1EA|nr:energy transducer TonB [Methylocaldum sp.]HYE37908.1 energy transducer TonB [Methylocaldum sp.]
MTSISADTNHGCRSWLEPTFSIVAAAALHAAIWVVWLTAAVDPKPVEAPPQLLEVSLVAAQPKADPEPPQPQVQQPPPKPEKPAPKKPDKPKLKPKPTVRPTPAPAPEPPQATTPTPSAPVEASTAPVQARPAAPAPFVEATYKAPGLNNPPTRYPRIALERRWEGTVTLRVQVLSNGSAGEIKIERSSGHGILDEATVEQVRNWRFIPARKGGQGVISWVIVPIEYKLKH